MILQSLKTQFLLAALFFLLSGQLSATDCKDAWMHPSSQGMRMEPGYSASLTDYKNMERHYSMRQDSLNIDIYYLNGFLLIKGMPDDKIEELERNAGLFMLPMNVTLLTAPLLIRAVPNGPCKVKEKSLFSIELSGGMMLGGRKITSAKGQISRVAQNDISYKMDVFTDPLARVKLSGTMSFAPKQETADNTDVSGYTVIRRSQILGIAGDSGIPRKIGELRNFILSKRDSN